MNPALLAAFPFLADIVSNAVSGKGIAQHIGGAIQGNQGTEGQATQAMPDAIAIPSSGPVQEQVLEAPQQPQYDASMSPDMKRQAAIQAMQARGVPMTTANLDMMLRSMHAMTANPAATESSILANVPDGGATPTPMVSPYGSIGAEIDAEKKAPMTVQAPTASPGEEKFQLSDLMGTTIQPPAALDKASAPPIQPQAALDDSSVGVVVTPKNVEPQETRKGTTAGAIRNMRRDNPMPEDKKDGGTKEEGSNKINSPMPPKTIKNSPAQRQLIVRQAAESLKGLSPSQLQPVLQQIYETDPKMHDEIMSMLSANVS